MPISIILMLVSTVLNVMKSPATAATAVSGIGAGAVIAFDKPPQTSVDWAIIIAGAIGMFANAIHANLVAAQRKESE